MPSPFAASAFVLLLVVLISRLRVRTAGHLLGVAHLASRRLMLPFLFTLGGVLAASRVLFAGGPSPFLLVPLVVVALEFPAPIGVLLAPHSGALAGAVGMCGSPLVDPLPIARTAFAFRLEASPPPCEVPPPALSHPIWIGGPAPRTGLALTFLPLRVIVGHRSRPLRVAADVGHHSGDQQSPAVGRPPSGVVAGFA